MIVQKKRKRKHTCSTS